MGAIKRREMIHRVRECGVEVPLDDAFSSRTVGVSGVLEEDNIIFDAKLMARRNSLAQQRGKPLDQSK